MSKRQTKRDKCDYHCKKCGRSFYTEKGLEHHKDRNACP